MEIKNYSQILVTQFQVLKEHQVYPMGTGIPEDSASSTLKRIASTFG